MKGIEELEVYTKKEVTIRVPNYVPLKFLKAIVNEFEKEDIKDVSLELESSGLALKFISDHYQIKDKV